MIQILNKFLPEDIFQELQNYCNKSDFLKIQAGDKEFLTIPVPASVLTYFVVEDHEITLAFIRKAHSEFDSDLRIHADSIINGKPTHLASVLYINESDSVSKNGTAFWTHEKYGLELPEDTPNEEFDRLLTEDSNDITKWEKHIMVPSIPNRLLTYQANLFHSKYPAKIKQGERIVLVVFYTKN